MVSSTICWKSSRSVASCQHTNYLFMGDYVDRGFNSVETISYILILKIMYPDRLTVLRGNHQNRQINRFYGFYEECEKKYGGVAVWNYFTDLFQYMPLAATVNGQLLCMHGGLSPSASTIDQIREINRFREVPHEGIMCDLLWSDPDENKLGFGPSPRQAGHMWGSDETQKFCHNNNLKMICRAHQLVMDGFNEVHAGKCVTVFSAPNYCYRCGNLASIVQVSEDLSTNYQQYDPAPRENEPRAVKRVPAYFL